jgi:hypothetical protein
MKGVSMTPEACGVKITPTIRIVEMKFQMLGTESDFENIIFRYEIIPYAEVDTTMKIIILNQSS